MADIIKAYREYAPASRFIGRRYGDHDRVHFSFAHLWMEWFDSQRFKALDPLAKGEWAETFPEAGSYIGLMRMKEGSPFEYWIGLFTPPDTPAPAGFESLDLPETPQGVCWVKGKEPDIYGQEEACIQRLEQEGITPALDREGFLVVQERYQCPRFTKAEEDTRVLDIVVMAEAEAAEELDPAGKFYCAQCRSASDEKICPECGESGTPLQGDDPIYLGELPGRLRNALQIAFGATEIPFNALATLGSGFTLAAGDIFETYKIYVPYTRSEEARAAFERVFEINGE